VSVRLRFYRHVNEFHNDNFVSGIDRSAVRLYMVEVRLSYMLIVFIYYSPTYT